jgi:hypothetical protein
VNIASIGGYFWYNLPLKTFIIGGNWMRRRIIYLVVSTKGFRIRTVMIDFP